MGSGVYCSLSVRSACEIGLFNLEILHLGQYDWLISGFASVARSNLVLRPTIHSLDADSTNLSENRPGPTRNVVVGKLQSPADLITHRTCFGLERS